MTTPLRHPPIWYNQGAPIDTVWGYLHREEDAANVLFCCTCGEGLARQLRPRHRRDDINSASLHLHGQRVNAIISAAMVAKSANIASATRIAPMTKHSVGLRICTHLPSREMLPGASL
jgi:hypothetical protein